MSGREVGPVNEEDLVSLAASGDDAAFGELVRIHQHEVYTVALRMVSDRELAYDVAQEAFVRAYRALPRFRGEAKLSTWFYRILVNEANRHHRFAWTRKRSAEPPEDTADPSAAVGRGDPAAAGA